MRTPAKLAIYAGSLAVAVAGAFGVGSLTGSPIDRAEGHGEHQSDGHAHGADGHGDHSSGGQASAGEASVPAGLQVSEAGYMLGPIRGPEVAGETGVLSFEILGPDGEPVTEFEESHEKDLHLIVVRADTADFRHVHPVIDAEGTWSIDWEWTSGGTYKVFADFLPSELGEEMTLARTVEVAGTHEPAPATVDAVVADVDGYTVTLTGDLVAGQGSRVTATFERDGVLVTDLEPYLGAYGHLVALRDGDLAYIHVHPDGEPGDGVTGPGPDVAFHVEAPSSGTYRLFLDFQVDGEVRTADFTLTAAAPVPADADNGSDTDADDGHADH
ncbi:hypothetical protein [Phytoactinopolyspora mesophila]|uniref:Heavy-metal-associated domain-containing protein n=1 Tax=Phytoactinopolyspora mesophila TaxID=2650750 RepID=A0A7K3M3R9_9ACTN|nr:hypothetical protein [Phytoactinopolyspora mesophila]NDL57088.1 hypothetical protein [Phytoactinopolyspora mesophila]